MFKYTAHDPESPLSVLAASFRLYCASFFYAIVLSLISSLTFLILNFYFEHHLDITNPYLHFLPPIFSTMISLIFFIPLIKRIYSVGAQLPISTRHAFSGFFVHFGRLLALTIIASFAGMIIPVLFSLIQPNFSDGIIVTFYIVLLLFYMYVVLKFYFTALFIILENKTILEALKASLQIEHHHMWLTFCILVLYYFGYQFVISFTRGYVSWMPWGLDLYLLALSVLTLPLFLSIQICQFFNLKRLRNAPQ